MYYSFDPITRSTTSITIAITSLTCITASILKQCPSPSPSPLSHALTLQSHNNVHHHRHHHHRHHVQHMHYSFNSITTSITSITIAKTSITCITASIQDQSPLSSPSRLSHALQLQSYNNVHPYRHHVYHMHYSFNPITMSIPIAITSITCITASIL